MILASHPTFQNVKTAITFSGYRLSSPLHLPPALEHNYHLLLAVYNHMVNKSREHLLVEGINRCVHLIKVRYEPLHIPHYVFAIGYLFLKLVYSVTCCGVLTLVSFKLS